MKRTTWMLAGATALVGVTVLGGVVALSGGDSATGDVQAAPVSTARVQQGKLSTTVSLNGTLTYRARPDGAPYAVTNHASGTYTQLPETGDKVGCGDVLYRVDDHPVLLLCGTVPAYREIHAGDAGQDVRQLNENLHMLGYDAGAGINPGDDRFTSQTQKALGKLQHAKGLAGTGSLAVQDAVFLPDLVRIATTSGKLGGSAQPGTQVLDATSDQLQVRVNLEAFQQGQVQAGDRAQITLPSNQTVTGRVDRLGTVAQAPGGQGGGGGQDSATGQGAGEATLPAYISLDDPGSARGFEEAPVQVDVTTKGEENALSVPVTALVGKAGGGFAVEVVAAGGRRDLVGVTLGLYDSSGGRVAVRGDVREGDLVVVPSL